MNFFKFLYPKDSIKRIVLEIEQDMRKLVQLIPHEPVRILWYGAYDIDPRKLVFWICTKSDIAKHELQSNISLNIALRSLLEKHNYPDYAREHVKIGFESQETVRRESNGDWYLHFK